MFEPQYDDKPEGPFCHGSADVRPRRQPAAPASDAPPSPLAPAVSGEDAARALAPATSPADDGGRDGQPATRAIPAHSEPAGARGRATPLAAFDGQ